MKKGYREQISPINYFPDDPSKEVKRVTFLNDTEDVGFLDLFLTEDTMYILYLEVKEQYRGQRFLEYMRPDKEETKAKFVREKTVWLNINPTIVDNAPLYLEYRRKLVAEGKLPASKIYMNGSKFGIEQT